MRGSQQLKQDYVTISLGMASATPEKNMLSEDLILAAGETIALVGPTGVGKTTIAHLIPRFFDPISGKVLLDGKNIWEIDVASLRKQVSLVSQDIFLFNGTVKENILYGRGNATDQEIFAAAKAANAHQFILTLENGYETRVGERGVKLSGGQKQRISIARAILKDAPILILDEATSSVDTQTEQLIQEADQIIVLKDGKILEQGKHSDLITRDGLYSKLCAAQSPEQLMG